MAKDLIKDEYLTRYAYREKSRTGFIFGTNPPVNIRVGDIEIQDFSRSIALSISHPNYLNCVGVHGERALHFNNRSTRDFSILMKSKDRYAMGGPIQWVPWISSNNKQSSYTYVTEFFRNIIRGMISFIKYLHSHHNASIKSLDIDNFVEQDEVVKFCRLDFIRKTEISASYDWKLLGKFVKDIVFKQYKKSEFPTDIADLLERMKNADEKCETLLLNHLSVLPTWDKFNFYMASCDIKETLDHAALGKYTAAVASIQQLRDWRHILTDTILPDVVLRCIKNTGYANTTQDMLRCVRNLTAHLPQHIKGSPIQTEVILSYMFVGQMIDLQYFLNENGVLHKFPKCFR